MRYGVKSAERLPTGKFNAKLITFNDGTQAVRKERMHSNDIFRGVPKDRAHIREVAVAELDRMLGFNLVPETLWVEKGEDKTPCSLQRFVFGHEAKELVPHIFDRTLPDSLERIGALALEINPESVKKLVILDLLSNNTDRHARNFLIAPDKNLWAIDNGLAFAPYLRFYRNVLHKYLFADRLVLPEEIEEKLRGLRKLDRLRKRLKRYGVDVDMTERRIDFILRHRHDLSFKTLAHGGYGKHDFPSYRDELQPKGTLPTVIEITGKDTDGRIRDLPVVLELPLE